MVVYNYFTSLNFKLHKYQTCVDLGKSYKLVYSWCEAAREEGKQFMYGKILQKKIKKIKDWWALWCKAKGILLHPVSKFWTKISKITVLNPNRNKLWHLSKANVLQSSRSRVDLNKEGGHEKTAQRWGRGQIFHQFFFRKACFYYYWNTFFCMVNIHACCNQ